MPADAPTPDPRATAEMVERSGAARAAFLAHWPKDDWSRFKPSDLVVEQYTAIAVAVAEVVLAQRDATHAAEVARLREERDEVRQQTDGWREVSEAMAAGRDNLRAQLDAVTGERDTARSQRAEATKLSEYHRMRADCMREEIDQLRHKLSTWRKGDEDRRQKATERFAKIEAERDAALERGRVLEGALRGLEDAHDTLAAGRSQSVYLAMLKAGQQDQLLALDEARRAARAALSAGQEAGRDGGETRT